MTVSFGGGAPATNYSRTDVPALARVQLQQLKAKIAAALVGTTDQMSKIHLQDLQERIKDALDPKKS
jgi:hypothetical protein